MPVSKEIKIIVSALDKTGQVFNQVGKKVDGLGGAMARAAPASKMFAAGAIAAATGVGALVKMAVSAAAQYEQSQIAFTTMLGSIEEAEKMLKDLADFAKRTPFELTGIESSAKQLLAMGIEADDILPTLKMLGDVSAGVNVPLDRLALNLGQVATQGKLTGRELRDFAVAGVPLLAVLADQMGKTKEEITAMVSAGEVGFPEVVEAFQAMTSEGGQFANLMDKQAASLTGMISNLKDSWDLFLRGEGQQLLEWGKKFVEMIDGVVQNQLPAWIDKIKNLINFFAENKEALIIVAGVIVGALVPAVYAAASAFAALAISLAPFLIAGAIIGGLVAAVYWIIKNWEKISGFFVDLWNKVKETFKRVAPTLLLALGPLGLVIRMIIKHWDEIKEKTEKLKGAIIDNWEKIANFLNGILAIIQHVFEEVWGRIAEFVTEKINEIKDEIKGRIDDIIWAFDVFREKITEIWTKTMESLRKIASVIWDAIGGDVMKGINFLKSIISSVGNEIKNIWKSFWDFLSKKANDAWRTISGPINSIIAIFDRVRNAATSAFDAVKNVAGTVSSIGAGEAGVSSILPFQKGGIVTRPTLGLLGEAGPEAVIPLSRIPLGGMGGAGIYTNITITGNTFMSDQDAAEKIGDMIIDQLREQVKI